MASVKQHLEKMMDVLWLQSDGCSTGQSNTHIHSLHYELMLIRIKCHDGQLSYTIM